MTAQFYGHTHNEQYRLFYDSVDVERPTNVAYISGSVTPSGKRNPSYRVYTIDGQRPGSTYVNYINFSNLYPKKSVHFVFMQAVLDFTTWIMNLTTANQQGASGSPAWFPLYQATSEYGVDDLFPSSMNDLYRRMLRDNTLFDKYFKYELYGTV